MYKRQDMQGGCFSISSLGGIGGRYFTPIINAPEVAIMGAVSYTHLRAHETVLDLVCRLLLEKKKHEQHDHRWYYDIYRNK